MSRRELREQVFRLLFRAEFYEEDELSEQQTLFLEELGQGETEENEEQEQGVFWKAASGKDTSYIEEKFKKILACLPEIDRMVNEAAHGWKTSRMGKVDLTLIRLAVYEMKYEENIPTGVAINEAVELAKSYGSDDSASFVNGILAKLV